LPHARQLLQQCINAAAAPAAAPLQLLAPHQTQISPKFINLRLCCCTSTIAGSSSNNGSRLCLGCCVLCCCGGGCGGAAAAEHCQCCCNCCLCLGKQDALVILQMQQYTIASLLKTM
jgi:hypothetical protein